MKTPRCPNAACPKSVSVILHGFYKTKVRKRLGLQAEDLWQAVLSTGEYLQVEPLRVELQVRSRIRETIQTL